MNKLYEILKKIHPEYDFRNSENYIADGLLDSLDIITLIDDIEQEFGVAIDGMDIVPENFSNAQVIMGLINK